MLSNEITKLLKCDYPIIQGGMAWVAEAKLAAAVSNAGGVGLIAGGSAPAEVIRKEIIKAKELTDKTFGLNIMLMSPHSDDLAQLICEEKVPVVTTGAGSPGKYIEMWKQANTIIIPVIASVALARRMEGMGVDALIAEGCEAGGHIGEQTTMVLVPQVVDAVSIPVIAAGGIADVRGVKAAFALGAKGIQVGTRFLASDECQIHENYKQLVLKAKDSDSAVTGRFTGHPVRSIKNKLTKKLKDLENSGMSLEEFENLSVGSLRKAAVDGELSEGSFMAGQIAGMIKDIKPCKDIIEELFKGL
jgi:enoyl-[acyl-carrier protein] reductase II